MTAPDATPVDPLAVEFSRLHDADAIFQWTPCRPTCGLCPCSGVPGFTDEAKRVLAERDARVRAEAWDEGYTRGFYDREVMPGEVRDASEGPSENPYREARP